MKYIFFAVVFIFVSHNIQSYALEHVDEKVKAYPSFTSTKKLADQINQDFSTELEKARAIYYWITHHISYDYKARYETIKRVRKTYHLKKSKERLEKERQEVVADYTMKSHIAICDGYATLYKRLSDLTNVHCEIVAGMSKTRDSEIGKLNKADHAWNAILIAGEWHLLDATWGAGVVDTKSRKFIPVFEDAYFMTPPEYFFLKHYPIDTRWLLISKTKEQFKNLPLFHSAYFNLGIEIKSPDNGMLTCTAEEIPLQFTLTEDPLLSGFIYFYDESLFSTRLTFKVIGDTAYASIPPPANSGSYLYIYYYGEPVVTYKVN